MATLKLPCTLAYVSEQVDVSAARQLDPTDIDWPRSTHKPQGQSSALGPQKKASLWALLASPVL